MTGIIRILHNDKELDSKPYLSKSHRADIIKYYQDDANIKGINLTILIKPDEELQNIHKGR